MYLKSAFLAFVLVAASGLAKADSWAMPTVRTYTSYNGEYRLTVFPRGLESQLSYFEDKVEGAVEPGQSLGESRFCEATLEKLVGSEYKELWRSKLVNDVAPVNAIVSDTDGSFVTFDNWHHTGYGEDAIVVYDSQGQTVRSLALTDVMSEEKFEALPRSVSSISWSGDHHIYTHTDHAKKDSFDYVKLQVRRDFLNRDRSSNNYDYYFLRMRDGAVIYDPQNPYAENMAKNRAAARQIEDKQGRDN